MRTNHWVTVQSTKSLSVCSCLRNLRVARGVVNRRASLGTNAASGHIKCPIGIMRRQVSWLGGGKRGGDEAAATVASAAGAGASPSGGAGADATAAASMSMRLDVETQMAGNLWKRDTAGSSTWTQRYFVLKDGFLLYYQERRTPMVTFDMHPKGVVPLDGVEIGECRGGVDERHACSNVMCQLHSARAMVAVHARAQHRLMHFSPLLQSHLTCRDLPRWPQQIRAEQHAHQPQQFWHQDHAALRRHGRGARPLDDRAGGQQIHVRARASVDA
jgi:hypothetical protein